MTQIIRRSGWILLLACLLGGERLVSSKSCILKAATIINRPLNVPVERFREWFSLTDIPTRLIRLNPGVKSIQILTDTSHRALLKPVVFPWTTITCTIDYDLNYIKGKSLTVDCREDAITQIFEGPKLLVDALSSIKLSAAGTGNFYINEPMQSFSVGVTVRVAIPIPDYYPDFLLRTMESTGSGVLQSKVEYDLGKLLGNVLQAFSVWEAEKEANKEATRLLELATEKPREKQRLERSVM